MQENYNVGIYARLSRDDERAGESSRIEMAVIRIGFMRILSRYASTSRIEISKTDPGPRRAHVEVREYLVD